MVINNKYEICGHTILFGYGCSSSDPWSLEYCREIRLSLMVTSDIVAYAMIDGDDIYRLRGGSTIEMQNWLLGASDVFKDFDEFKDFFKRDFEKYVGKFSEMKKDLDDSKRRNDEFKKLSPEEKQAMIAQWRKERKEQMKKEKQG